MTNDSVHSEEEEMKRFNRMARLVVFIIIYGIMAFMTIVGIVLDIIFNEATGIRLVLDKGIIAAIIYWHKVMAGVLAFGVLWSLVVVTLRKLSNAISYKIKPTCTGRLTAAGYIFVMLVMFISCIGISTGLLVYHSNAELPETLLCTTLVVTYSFWVGIWGDMGPEGNKL